MIGFETSVRVARPVEHVFAVVSNPLVFPRWNSAVETVRLVTGETGALGSTYTMHRALPTGRAENGLEVFAVDPPTGLGIRTTSGPTPFSYRYRFVPESAATVVHLDATVELPGLAAALGPLAARGVKRGVDANFATLKRLLEA